MKSDNLFLLDGISVIIRIVDVRLKQQLHGSVHFSEENQFLDDALRMLIVAPFPFVKRDALELKFLETEGFQLSNDQLNKENP